MLPVIQELWITGRFEQALIEDRPQGASAR